MRWDIKLPNFHFLKVKFCEYPFDEKTIIPNDWLVRQHIRLFYQVYVSWRLFWLTCLVFHLFIYFVILDIPVVKVYTKFIRTYCFFKITFMSLLCLKKEYPFLMTANPLTFKLKFTIETCTFWTKIKRSKHLSTIKP